MKNKMVNWRKPIVYGLLYLSRSKIPKYLKEIRRVEKLSKKEIKKYQEGKLRKLLLHSWKNVPYYTKILERSKVVVNGKVNLKNFNKIPILTKKIIRKEGKNLCSKDYKKRKPYENTSGGSTGEPVRFIQDRDYEEWNNATKIYLKTFENQQVGQKELRFWGSERDLLEGKESFKIRLRNWLYNRKEFNTFKMSEKEIKQYIKDWNKYKPRWVEAYVQSIYEFAKFIKKNNLKIYSPKGVLTSAGTLYPDMKKTIEEVFKCLVFNRYGSREVGGIACSRAKQDELNIAFWNNHVEILGKNKKLGKIHVTTLNNFTMPLIRYDIGDVGEITENNRVIKRVVGRETDIFASRNGKKIDGAYFRHSIFYKDWVKNYQIIQKDYNLVLYKIILAKKIKLNKDEVEEIERWVKKALGNDCKTKIEFVKKINPNKSGKYSYTRSEVS